MMAFKRALLLAFCVWLLSIGQPPSSSWAQSGQDAIAYEDMYDLVIQVERDKTILSRTILGLQRGYDDYYIPVGALANLLRIKADIDLATGTVQGWYRKPEHEFSINAAEGFYTLRGERVDMAPDDAFTRELGSGFGDIYIRYGVLNQILPLELTFDFSRMSLELNTTDRLPYEEIALRKERREKLLARQNAAGIDTTGFKTVRNPYKMFTRPVLDIRTSTGWSNQESEITNNTNISGKNDLLGFSADYGLDFSHQDGKFEAPDVLRMTLTRRAYDEPMPLGVRELKIGDVSAPTPTLIRGSNSGRGVSVSSRPLSRQGVFDEVIVEGTAPSGWEIELYRGKELIEFGTVGESGIYRFENVQLLTGGNRIRVMLYGPEGQVEERVEEYRIGNLLRPGAFEYNASFVDTENRLIEIDSDSDRRSVSGEDDQGFAYSGSARLGVNRWISLFGTGTSSVTRGGKIEYATLGADLSLGRVRANIEGYRQFGGGNAVDTRVATNLLGWRVNLNTQFLNDFESNAVGFDDSAKVFDFNGSLSRRFQTSLGRLSLRGSVNYEEDEDETSTTRYQLNKSITRRGQTYGNRITANYKDHDLNRVEGLFNTKHRLTPKLSLRSRVTYDVRPNFDFRDALLDFDYRHSKDFNAGLNIGQSLQNSRTRVTANASYDFQKFLGSVNTGWSRGDGFDFTVRASTSLAPYGKNGKYIMNSRSLRSRTALNSRLFLDRNLNAVYDEGDVPVDNAMLMLNKQESGDSDVDGFVQNVRSARGNYVALTLVEESTENPFYKSYYPGFNVLSRPGVRQHVDFPIVETGVIEGYATFEDGRPVPGLRMQLVDGEGRLLNETMTFYDGYYSFEFVKPGSYIVRADPALNLNLPPRIITLSTDALFAYGSDVRLLEKAGLPKSDITVDKPTVQKNVAPILAKLVQLQSALRGAADSTF